MPHKTSKVKDEVRADKPIINPNIEESVRPRRSNTIYCIGELPLDAKRCAQVQAEEGAPYTLECTRTCVAKLIRRNKKTRRTPESR